MIRSLKLMQVFFFFLFCHQMNADAAAGKCLVHSNGTVVATWQNIDSSGSTTIIGAIGSTSTDPSTWSQTVLSSGISSSQNSTPVLVSNSNNDVLVLWQYPDPVSFAYMVAASMLPAGTTTWNSAKISSDDYSAGFLDQTASIDADGNILATWTVYDSTNNIALVRGATAIMGTNTTWNPPITIGG